MIGEIIQKYRRRRSIKQIDLAERLRMTQANLSTIERNGIKGVDKAVKILNKIGYEVELRLTRDGNIHHEKL